MFYVRSNARICLHFKTFICKKPTLISTKHKSFLTCSLDRNKTSCLICTFLHLQTFLHNCSESSYCSAVQIMDTELWLGLGWDDGRCCLSHDSWHRLHPQHQWLIHVLHPANLVIAPPSHSLQCVQCSYLQSTNSQCFRCGSCKTRCPKVKTTWRNAESNTR